VLVAVPLVVLLVVLLAAVVPSTRSGRAGRAGAATAPVGASIGWAACPGRTGYRCGTLVVPADEHRPDGPTVGLAVAEHPVTDPRGVIVLNPGGPGESAVAILPVLVASLPAPVVTHFTLVGFDERGTGASEPLRCGPSPAAAASAVPGTAAAAALFASLPRSCRASASFPTATSTVAAMDLDRLRAALHVSRISFYGLSYGTVLGSVYRQLYPTRVRAMVLDGAVDANTSLAVDATEEAPAIERAVRAQLPSGCRADPTCPLADPVAAYTAVAARLVARPLPAPGHGDALPVTVGDLQTATLLYLSAPALTPGYFSALARAEDGDGGPLRDVAVGLETDLDGSSLVGALWAYTCNDAATHPSAGATATLARSLATRWPLGGSEAVANNLVGCPGWPSPAGPTPRLTRVAGGTPLVIGTTGDPNTPYVAAGQLAATIGGRLVTWVGQGHTWLLNGSSNGCMDRVVTAYLTSGTSPRAGTRC
jgi:pimeloyl-ACP methyl ester carboxylesterase